MPYVPGTTIEGYCLNCRCDTGHTILEMHGLQIRLVRCERCGAEGALHMPRARARAGIMETAERRRAAAKRKPAHRPDEKSLGALLAGRDVSQAMVYDTSMTLSRGDLISHPRFGLGIVTAVTDPGKALVMFENGERMMACNRH